MRFHRLTAAAAIVLALSGCSGARGGSGGSPTNTAQGASRSATPTLGAPSVGSGNYAQRSNEFVASCMADAGWQVTVDSDGISANVPVEQQSAYRADVNRCNDAFSAANPIAPLTKADYRELYRQELLTMKCLEKNGYPALSEPISEEQYVDDYVSGRSPSWNAYSAVTGGDVQALQKKCPQPFLERFK